MKKTISILPFLSSQITLFGRFLIRGKLYLVTLTFIVVIFPINKQDYVNKIIPKYSLTEGLTEKAYRKLIDQVLKKISGIAEWHNDEILKKIGNVSWSKSIFYIHKNKENDINSKFHRRLAYDEILANLLVLSQVRKRIKKFKKKNKKFDDLLSKKLINNFNFVLTQNQMQIIEEINNDIKSDYKMFRLLQGDVGSGKTIISFIAATNVINSNYQVALMAPTEILAKQHYNLATKIFKSTGVNIEFLTGKSDSKKKINSKKLVKWQNKFFNWNSCFVPEKYFF